jgi:hypothetical protein
MVIHAYKLTSYLVLLLVCSSVYSQQNGVGGSLIYNFQTKGVGLDARYEIPLTQVKILEGLSVVPQIGYFPWFNKVSEFYMGSSIHLGVYNYNKWAFYALANLSYNGWINYKDSPMADAKFSNLGLEGGIGITRNTCLRPFAEIRYNVKWREATLRIGFMYTIDCEKRGQVPCSKIPKQPEF